MSERPTMGGKPVFEIPARSSVINLESGFKPKLLCDGPTFSTGVACVYTCSFCYVPASMMGGIPGDIGLPHEAIVLRRSNALAEMRKKLLDRRGNPRFGGIDQTGRVIYASPLVDVAANMELVKETVEACNIIMELTGWHIRLLSKSNLLPYVAKLLIERRREFWRTWTNPRDPEKEVRERLIFGVSTGTLDDKLARSFEQGTALPSKRLQSLQWLQDNGFRTFGMICPIVPQKDYDDFAREALKLINQDRCEHIWAEVINVRGESMTRTAEALRGAGFEWEAKQIELVSWDHGEWELYAREAFAALRRWTKAPARLRFLQYVNRRNEAFWRSYEGAGAVCLG
jgi:DNA repair photolyase